MGRFARALGAGASELRRLRLLPLPPSSTVQARTETLVRQSLSRVQLSELHALQDRAVSDTRPHHPQGSCGFLRRFRKAAGAPELEHSAQPPHRESAHESRRRGRQRQLPPPRIRRRGAEEPEHRPLLGEPGLLARAAHALAPPLLGSRHRAHEHRAEHGVCDDAARDGVGRRGAAQSRASTARVEPERTCPATVGRARQRASASQTRSFALAVRMLVRAVRDRIAVDAPLVVVVAEQDLSRRALAPPERRRPHRGVLHRQLWRVLRLLPPHALLRPHAPRGVLEAPPVTLRFQAGRAWR
eukprot:6210049-Pleurochrysis_carterae.AAC.2